MRVPVSAAVPALYYCHRALCASLRVREFNRGPIDRLDAAGGRLVISLWHDELFPLILLRRQLDIVTLVSASRDGELLAGVLQRQGVRSVRGSSGRGGVNALLGAARLMKNENVHVCLTVDGPRGPRHKVKDGAVFLAHHADAYIVPLRLRIEPSLRVKSWDRFQIPLPFCRVEAHFADPWKMPPGALDKTAIDMGRQRLERDMDRLGQTWPESKPGTCRGR